MLIRDKSGCFYVNLLVKGGPAHYSGRLQQGRIPKGKTVHLSFFNLLALHRNLPVWLHVSLCSVTRSHHACKTGDILRFVDDLDLRERPHENPVRPAPLFAF